MDEDDDAGNTLNRIMDELSTVEYHRENKSTHDVVISKKLFHPGSFYLYLISDRRRNLLQLSICCCFDSRTILSDLFLLF